MLSVFSMTSVISRTVLDLKSIIGTSFHLSWYWKSNILLHLFLSFLLNVSLFDIKLGKEWFGKRNPVTFMSLFKGNISSKLQMLQSVQELKKVPEQHLRKFKFLTLRTTALIVTLFSLLWLYLSESSFQWTFLFVILSLF